MSLIRQLAGQTLIYGAGSVLGKVLHFVFIAAFLTRKFRGEQELFGIYTELYFYAAFLLILYVMRMETGLFRFGTDKNNRQKAYSTAGTTVLCTASLGTLLLLVFSEPIAALLSYPDQGIYVRIFAAIIFFDAIVAVPFARMRLENQAKRFALLRIFNVLVTIGLLLFFLEFLPRLEGQGTLGSWYHDDRRLLFVFVSNLVASFTIFLMVSPDFRKMKFAIDKELLKKFWQYLWPLVIVALAGVINQSVSAPLQKIALAFDLETNQYWMGIYGACLKLAILLNLVTTAYNYAAEPFFFKRNHESTDLTIFADATRAYGIFASIVIGFTLFFLPFVSMLIDSSYWSGLFIVAPMLFAFYILGMYYNFSIWYKLKDRTTVGAALAGSAGILTIVISLILLPKIGIMASVIAAITAYSFMSILCLGLGRKIFPVPYPYVRLMFYPFLAFGLYYLLENIRFAQENDLKGLALRAGFFLLLLGILYLTEKDFLKKNFSKQFKS